MTIRLLFDADRYATVLQFEVGKGPIREIPRPKDYEDRSNWEGRFAKVKGDYYCVYATAKGPCFYCPVGHFLIADPACKFKHERGEETHRFTLEHSGQIVLDLTYPHWDDLDIDQWSSEDWIDLFMWLTTSLNDPAFHRDLTYE